MAMGSFFSELKRRNVYRVGGAYAVAAFGLIEIVSNVTPMLDLPVWLGRALILVLIIGFPVTLFAAWMIEGKPEGGGQPASTTRLDFVLAAALVLIVGLLIYQQVVPARDTAPQKTAATSSTPTEGVSIAVLPFLNLSGDPQQEFFSDGMTEEITSALAKVKGLKVVGRTSAFEFKGQNKDLRAIGQALSASHILEGSIRKDGSQIRVTAQLIKAGDGTHIWTDNYDRELKGIFALQDDIAKSIAGALRIPLGLKAGETLVASRAADNDAYQDYLRAKSIVRRRGRAGNDLMEAVRLLELVVAREPQYAPGWGLLGLAYSSVPQEDAVYRIGTAEELRRVSDMFLPKSEAAARRALDLEPGNADASVALGNVMEKRGLIMESERFYREALAIDATNPDLLHFSSLLMSAAGRWKEALPIRRRLQELEPLVSIYNAGTSRALMVDGQYAAAAQLLSAMPADSKDGAALLGETYAAMGRYTAAAEAISRLPAGVFPPGEIEAAVSLLRKAPARVAPGDLPAITDRNLLSSYIYVGASERAIDGWLAAHERALDASYPFVFDGAWYPWHAAARKTERFKAIVRRRGMVDYWRARGWPDVCRPVGTDDFECS